MIGAISLLPAAVSIIAALGCIGRAGPTRDLVLDGSADTARAQAHETVRWTERLGRRLRSLARREPDPIVDRAMGRTLLLALVLLIVQPILAVVAVVALQVRSVIIRRRRTRARETEISNGLSEVIDLFAIALLTGTTVSAATHQVTRWSAGEFAVAFEWCEQQVAHGRPLADALELLPERLGPQVRPLTAALVSTERYGAPIAQSLMQLGADSRADQRRRAEAAARRLPVALLFPLVICVLPAFLLLTIVPVVADSISRFDLIGSL